MRPRRVQPLQRLFIEPDVIFFRPAAFFQDIEGVRRLPEGPGDRLASAELHRHRVVLPVPDHRLIIDQPVLPDIAGPDDELIMLLIIGLTTLLLGGDKENAVEGGTV